MHLLLEPLDPLDPDQTRKLRGSHPILAMDIEEKLDSHGTEEGDNNYNQKHAETTEYIEGGE